MASATDREKEKLEKQQKINNQIKHVPKDAQVIMSILKELNITDYEPRVINQLLEFTYRYVTCILDDAKIYANHAKKKTIDLEDVKLASEIVLDKTFTTPPPRHVVTKLAEVKNSIPLPPIKPHCGLRLPPDRYCLSACNYKLRAASQPKKMMKSAIEPRSNIKTQLKSQPTPTSGIKRPVVQTPKSQLVTIPKPVFKFTSTTKPAQAKSTGDTAKPPQMPGVDIKMEVDEDANSVNDMKRKRDEDDFEIVT